MSLIDQLSQAWHEFIRPETSERPAPGEVPEGSSRPDGDCHPIGKLDNGNSLWECKSSFHSETLPSLENFADSLIDRIRGFFNPKRYTAGIRGGASGLVAPPAPAPLGGPVPPKAPSRTSK